MSKMTQMLQVDLVFKLSRIFTKKYSYIFGQFKQLEYVEIHVTVIQLPQFLLGQYEYQLLYQVFVMDIDTCHFLL